MSDTDDDPLEQEFKARCNAAVSPDEWMFTPDGDTDYEKGIRRGLELVLLTIRDQHGPIDLYSQDDGSYRIDILLWDDMSFAQDFAKTIQSAIAYVRGDDDEIRRLSAYLRAQADEVDKAIG